MTQPAAPNLQQGRQAPQARTLQRPMNIDWPYWIVALGMPLLALLGVALTAITLPGAWLIVLGAFAVKLWQPEALSWWTIAAMIVLAVLGEVVEFLSGALGAAKAGGGKHGALGAVLGSIAGALLGIPFLPPLGPIIGGALGAAAGAVAGERWLAKKTWQDSARVGTGAGIGRLVAMLAKTLITVAVGLVACLAVVIP